MRESRLHSHYNKHHSNPDENINVSCLANELQ
jgi:hypothetical protein